MGEVMFVIFLLRDGASLLSEMTAGQANQVLHSWQSGAEFLYSPHPHEVWVVSSRHVQTIRVCTREQFQAMTGQAAQARPAGPSAFNPGRYLSGN